jgi:rhodanese-related sulfurtransferase
LGPEPAFAAVGWPTLLVVVLTSALANRVVWQMRWAWSLRQWLAPRLRGAAALLWRPWSTSFWLGLAAACLLTTGLREGLLLGLLASLSGSLGSRGLGRARQSTGPSPRSHGQPCQQCGRPWHRHAIERDGRSFCCLSCWFDHHRDTRLEADHAAAEVLSPDGTPAAWDVLPAPQAAVDPAAAQVLLNRGQGHVYLDVRTAPEFAAGHPAGAVNVPLFHRRGDRLAPNRAFLREVTTHFPRTTPLVVDGAAGSRAAIVVRGLLAAGYGTVIPVTYTRLRQAASPGAAGGPERGAGGPTGAPAPTTPPTPAEDCHAEPTCP